MQAFRGTGIKTVLSTIFLPFYIYTCQAVGPKRSQVDKSIQVYSVL